MGKKFGQKPLADVFESMDSLQTFENDSPERRENALGPNAPSTARDDLDEERFFRDANPLRAILGGRKYLVGLGALFVGLSLLGISHSLGLLVPRPQQTEEIAQADENGSEQDDGEREKNEQKPSDSKNPENPANFASDPAADLSSDGDMSLYQDDDFGEPEIVPATTVSDISDENAVVFPETTASESAAEIDLLGDFEYDAGAENSDSPPFSEKERFTHAEDGSDDFLAGLDALDSFSGEETSDLSVPDRFSRSDRGQEGAQRILSRPNAIPGSVADSHAAEANSRILPEESSFSDTGFSGIEENSLGAYPDAGTAGEDAGRRETVPTPSRSKPAMAMMAASELGRDTTSSPSVSTASPRPSGRKLSEHERRPMTERPISENTAAENELLREQTPSLSFTRGQSPNSATDAESLRSAVFGANDASRQDRNDDRAGNSEAYQPIEHDGEFLEGDSTTRETGAAAVDFARHREQDSRSVSPETRSIEQDQSQHPSREEYSPQFAKIRETPQGASLPNHHGQLWVEYDITPYTQAVGVVPGSLPEQNIVKWILRETGEQSWHSEPFGILSADSETLYVYHTPEMQEIIAEIVDRFMNPHAQSDQYSFRLISLNNPSWFATNHTLLKPVRIDTPGVHGWLLEKEDYARLLADVARRSDYKELCSPQFVIRSGRSYPISSSIPKNYVKSVESAEEVWPGYVTRQGVIPEGFTMTLTPLSGVDGKSSHVLVRCDVLQVEKMLSTSVSVPSRATVRQRTSVEMPQIVHFHLDEQLWWPKDKVLLLDLGTIPMPASAQYNDAGKLIPELSRRLSGGTSVRGNILLFVECRKQ